MKNSTHSAKRFDKTAFCKKKNYFHITQLCPNCCLHNAEKMFTHLLQVQPVDAILLAAVKSRSDAYYSVVSTSPVLYLTHPTSQPLRRPLSVTLPCPPNPEKKRRDTRVQKGETEPHHNFSGRSTPPQDQPASNRVRYDKPLSDRSCFCEGK